jgi:hypothetical protein
MEEMNYIKEEFIKYGWSEKNEENKLCFIKENNKNDEFIIENREEGIYISYPLKHNNRYSYGLYIKDNYSNLYEYIVTILDYLQN